MPTSGPNSSPSTKPKSKTSAGKSKGKGRVASVARRVWASRAGRWAVISILSISLLGAITFGYFYVKFSRMIDQKLAAGPYGTSSRLYATPRLVMLGEEGGPADFANYLRRAGYSESRNNRAGWYLPADDRIDIYPGPDAYDPEPAALKFDNGRLTEIISLRDNAPRTQFRMEPELVTSLHGEKREKRRVVKFADIPKVMVDAVLAAEDKRFFAHSGFDPIGILRAVYVDVKERRNNQGASTLTMQLSRTLLLTTERSWKRKAAEALITLHLEQKLPKEEIFEHYANTIYIGHHGSFSIHGFAEGANVYLGKDLSRVTLPEAAFLAGMVQSPFSRNPFKHPERAKSRRNAILKLMRENGYITEEQLVEASTAPLTVSHEGGESGDAPYFVDLVNDFLQNTFQDRDFQTHSYRVYTTVDMNLQRDAVAAVKAGLVEVDAALKRRFKNYGAGTPAAQVALVALDAQNGEVRALVGGRSYGQSQLNRALAKRQPGSAFKPFVYAAALGTGIDGDPDSITPVTKLVDEPTTFWYDNKPYEPGNFKDQYYGPVTLRQALAKSLNIPTVKLAEKAGYRRVAQLAREVGLGNDIKGTPAVALGSYVTSPLEVAGAYTVFPTLGQFHKPAFVASIRDDSGSVIFSRPQSPKRALDPRVAYLMTNLMEEVLRSGTGAGVRGRGFWQPAAGKTGTSHDGWFAGYTSRLICVVWVGFDDNRELELEGARSALPVWTEFMKRAHAHREYRNAAPFQAPDGIVTADIDPGSGLLASSACPGKVEFFIAGTQPLQACGGGGGTHIAGWDPVAEPKAKSDAPAAVAPIETARRAERKSTVIPVTPPPAPAPGGERPKGFFGRLRGIFK